MLDDEALRVAEGEAVGGGVGGQGGGCEGGEGVELGLGAGRGENGVQVAVGEVEREGGMLGR